MPVLKNSIVVSPILMCNHNLICYQNPSMPPIQRRRTHEFNWIRRSGMHAALYNIVMTHMLPRYLLGVRENRVLVELCHLLLSRHQSCAPSN